MVEPIPKLPCSQFMRRALKLTAAKAFSPTPITPEPKPCTSAASMNMGQLGASASPNWLVTPSSAPPIITQAMPKRPIIEPLTELVIVRPIVAVVSITPRALSVTLKSACT